MGKNYKTLTALARAIGFSPTSLANWKAQHADAPSGFDEDSWRGFIDRHELGNSRNRNHRGMEELRRRKLASEVRINELKIAKDEGRMIPAADVDAFLLHLASKTKSAVYQRFVRELAPKLAGLEPAQIIKLTQESADGLTLSMQDEVAEYLKEQAAARPKALPAEPAHE